MMSDRGLPTARLAIPCRSSRRSIRNDPDDHPHVGDSNDIQLEMASRSAIASRRRRQRSSDRDASHRKNSVTVQDGGTVAVAGLTENRGRQMDKRVPFFSSIPLIGEAFKNRDQIRRRKSPVFVTAHIVREPGAMARGSHRVRGAGIGGRPQPPGRNTQTRS